MVGNVWIQQNYSSFTWLCHLVNGKALAHQMASQEVFATTMAEVRALHMWGSKLTVCVILLHSFQCVCVAYLVRRELGSKQCCGCC